MTATAVATPLSLVPVLPGAYALTTAFGSDATFTFNAADDKLAFIFQAKSTTPPDQVKFVCASYTSTGTIDATIQTIDATTGFPSGSLVTDTATGSVSVASTGTKTATGLAGTGVLVVGTYYAIVLTGASGFSGNFTVRRTTGTTGQLGSPYHATKDSAGAWTRGGGESWGLAIGLMTSGGASIHVPGLTGAFAFASATFTDATNPDERGNRFVPDVPATCYGAMVVVSLGSVPADTNSFTLKLYSTHTATPTELASLTVDGDLNDAGMAKFYEFPTPVDLAAGTTYAIVCKATSSGNLIMGTHTYASAAELGCYLADSFYSTTRNGGSGSFTDGNTVVYTIYPLFSKFDDGAGGGGGLAMPVSGRICA